MVGLKLGISAALASAVLLSTPAAQAQNLEDILGTVVQGLSAQQAAEQERALWDAVQKRNTIAAYRSYLDDYPSGPHAQTARARIAAATGQDDAGRKTDEPTEGRTGPVAAQRLEADLGLSSSARRQIQRRVVLCQVLVGQRQLQHAAVGQRRASARCRGCSRSSCCSS